MDENMTLRGDTDTQISDQAGMWLGRLLESNADRTRFFAWLEESPRNVEEMLRMLAIAQEIGAFSAEQLARIEETAREIGTSDISGANVVPLTHRSAVPLAGTAPEDPTRIRVSGGSGSSTENAVPVARWQETRDLRMRWVVGIAASLFLMASSAWYLRDDGWHTYSTTVGEQRATELPDGSVVHLNTASSVAIRFGQQAREVRLDKGEALFKVEHDASRPFRVHAGDAVVQAIGTEFDVNRQPQGTHVSVIEGLVQVSRKDLLPPPSAVAAIAQLSDPQRRVAAARELERKSGGSLHLLAAGEKAQISPRGEITNRESLDVAKATAWRQRRLVFEDTPLADIASQFNQHNVRPKIRVQGSAGSERHFSGTFDADEPISIKHALAGDRTLVIEDLGDEIVIRTREQEETSAQ